MFVVSSFYLSRGHHTLHGYLLSCGRSALACKSMYVQQNKSRVVSNSALDLHTSPSHSSPPILIACKKVCANHRKTAKGTKIKENKLINILSVCGISGINFVSKYFRCKSRNMIPNLTRQLRLYL
jgi:hypothetical protein